MLKIWAHFSIAWWLDKIYKRAVDTWANAIQIFSKSPRGWKFWEYADNVFLEAKKQKEKYHSDFGMIHSVYLINLAKPFEEAMQDRQSVIDDFITAYKLGFDSVNIHLWKYKEDTKEQAFKNMKQNVEAIIEEVKDLDVKFLFENTAWQGTEIGYKFEELWEFINSLSSTAQSKVYVCIDTAHAWWAWYDINNFEQVLKEFDKYIGLQKLKVFHLNDSMAICESRLDRHANLWRWFIWLPALSQVIKRAEKHDIALILETPDADKRFDEIKMIKQIVAGSFDIDSFHKNNFKKEYLPKFEKEAK